MRAFWTILSFFKQQGTTLVLSREASDVRRVAPYSTSDARF